jgi:hypothetical protein
LHAEASTESSDAQVPNELITLIADIIHPGYDFLHWLAASRGCANFGDLRYIHDLAKSHSVRHWTREIQYQFTSEDCHLVGLVSKYYSKIVFGQEAFAYIPLIKLSKKTKLFLKIDGDSDAAVAEHLASGLDLHPGAELAFGTAANCFPAYDHGKEAHKFDMSGMSNLVAHSSIEKLIKLHMDMYDSEEVELSLMMLLDK